MFHQGVWFRLTSAAELVALQTQQSPGVDEYSSSDSNGTRPVFRCIVCHWSSTVFHQMALSMCWLTPKPCRQDACTMLLCFVPHLYCAVDVVV